ncbi:MAG: hypothetical protein ACOY4D_07020 [Pseudomonadota bacterium]
MRAVRRTAAARTTTAISSGRAAGRSEGHGQASWGLGRVSCMNCAMVLWGILEAFAGLAQRGWSVATQRTGSETGYA